MEEVDKGNVAVVEDASCSDREVVLTARRDTSILPREIAHRLYYYRIDSVLPFLSSRIYTDCQRCFYLNFYLTVSIVQRSRTSTGP